MSNAYYEPRNKAVLLLFLLHSLESMGAGEHTVEKAPAPAQSAARPDHRKPHQGTRECARRLKQRRKGHAE